MSCHLQASTSPELSSFGVEKFATHLNSIAAKLSAESAIFIEQGIVHLLAVNIT